MEKEMSSVSDCIAVLNSTGLPVIELVLPEKEYNKLLMEIMLKQRTIEDCAIAEDYSAITYLGIKISKYECPANLKLYEVKDEL
jgi:hypothetical protein